jgi:hypothetical protein
MVLTGQPELNKALDFLLSGRGGMVDAEDLKSSEPQAHAGSSPVARTMPPEGETIVAAAIRVGKLIVSSPPPARHHHLIHGLSDINRKLLVKPDDQGFLTSTGRFVSREEAWEIAGAACQIREVTGPFGTLFSEDLW